MKNTKLIGTVAALLVTTTAFANTIQTPQGREDLTAVGLGGTQSSTSGSISVESAPAPTSPLTFTPSVQTGVRTVLSGPLTAAGGNNNSVGPYVTPAFELGYKQPNFNLGLSYTLEASGAAGYGSKNESKKFADNLYFQHNPTLSASGGLTEDWKLIAVTDIVVTNSNGQQSSNEYALAFMPEIQHKVNETLSLSVGYWFDRTQNFDSTVGLQTPKKGTAGEFAATEPTEYFASQFKALKDANPNLGLNPTMNGNSGFVRAKIKAGDVNINSYVKAGRSQTISDTGSSSAYNYRWNTDIALNATQELSLNLRYRLQVSDPVETSAVTMLNRGRVIASYALNDVWSLDLTNTFDLTSSKASGSGGVNKYSNENYLGTTVKF